MVADKAARLRSVMTREFPEAEVSGYEHLIVVMKNHEKDRHVAAAAVKAGAQVIVTANLRDFTALPEGVEAQSADELLQNLFDLDPGSFVGLLREQAEDLVNPPMTFDELLDRLARVVATFVAAVRAHVGEQVGGDPGSRTR